MEMEVEMKWEWDGKGKEAVGGYQPREGRTLGGAVIRYFGKGKPGARDQPFSQRLSQRLSQAKGLG